MFNLVHVIIQLISGAVGGNLAGALFKNISLGTAGNSIAGIIGGPLGGYILNMITGSGAVDAAAGAAAGAADAGTGGLMVILQQIAGGGIGGAILMAIIGFIRKAMAGNAPT